MLALSLNLLNVGWDMCLYVRVFVVLSPNNHRRISWIKARSGYTHQDHQNLHRAVLAHNSDFFVAGCVLNAFPNVKLSKMTSLDHSIWFHTDVNSQDWHLFVVECEHCAGGRSLNVLRYVVCSFYS